MRRDFEVAARKLVDQKARTGKLQLKVPLLDDDEGMIGDFRKHLYAKNVGNV